MIDAAIYLYGNNSPEVVSVTNAWHAVGVGNVFPPPIIKYPGVSNLLCYGVPKSFSASNWVNGYYFWERSNTSINISDINTSPTNVSATSSSGTSILRIKNSNGKIFDTYSITFTSGSPPSITGISGSTSVSVCAQGSCGGYMYTATGISGSPNDYDYEWNLNYSSNNIYGYGYWANAYFPYAGTYQMSCRPTNACGAGSWVYLNNIEASEYSPSPPHPNPVSDVLIVALDATANTNKISASPTYDVRLLDEQGNLLRQQQSKGGTIQFNVSSLPNGIYFLYIYDGVNSTPSMQQIIVVH